MNPLREYEIAFVGLKEGIHYFDYKIDRSFFSLFENAPDIDCKLDIKLKFDKKNTFFILDFQISGFVNMPCNRCATPLDYPVDADNVVVVKMGKSGDENRESDEDVIYIGHSETHFNVAQLIYEFAILSIPVNRVYCSNLPGRECNLEALKILEELKEKKDNTEEDPRWSSLKNIKFK